MYIFVQRDFVICRSELSICVMYAHFAFLLEFVFDKQCARVQFLNFADLQNSSKNCGTCFFDMLYTFVKHALSYNISFPLWIGDVSSIKTVKFLMNYHIFSPVFQWQLHKLITIVFDIYYSTVNNPRYELNCHSKIDNKNDKIKEKSDLKQTLPIIGPFWRKSTRFHSHKSSNVGNISVGLVPDT